MGRPKGKITKNNRYWTKEEKTRIVLRVINHENSLNKILQEEKVNSGQLHSWVKKYLDKGEEGLINAKNPGAPYKCT